MSPISDPHTVLPTPPDGRPLNLVIGGTGNVGRHVVALLASSGERVRASARRSGASTWPEDVEAVSADLADADSLARAFEGVDRIFVYANPTHVDSFCARAKAAGVRRVVVLSSASVLLPWAKGNAIAEEHRSVEAAISASGLPFIPVRPLVLATNALYWAESLRDSGRIGMYRPEAVSAPVHERDIAAVAVAALLSQADDRLLSAMLTGPTLLSQAEQIAAISTLTGFEYQIDRLTRDEAVRAYGDPDHPEEAHAILDFIDDCANGGSPATATARLALGREPSGFPQWVRDHLDAFKANHGR